MKARLKLMKSITLNYGGKKYTLEFNRDAIRQMEGDGFVITDIETKPVSTIPELFAGAFIAHHATTARETIDEMFSKTPHKGELLKKLGEMYAEQLESLMDEPEADEGNLEWGASW